MENLQVESAKCFGWHLPKNGCWWYILNPAISRGWHSVDVKKAEQSLSINVNESYKSLATFTVKDLDTDTTYVIWFDNSKKLWDVKIELSQNADVLPEERAILFKSQLFKRTCVRTNEILMRSLDLYQELIKPHIARGDMINVNEIELEAIEYMISDQDLMRNLRLGKYVKS